MDEVEESARKSSAKTDKMSRVSTKQNIVCPDINMEASMRQRQELYSTSHKLISSSIFSGMISEFQEKKVARYMNSYKLNSDKPFNHEAVEKILQDVMSGIICNLRYDDPEFVAGQAKLASNVIRNCVKELQFDRYKIIVLVTIGERNCQDVLSTLKFLWDAERDGYATYSLKNHWVFAIAQCFGIYYE